MGLFGKSKTDKDDNERDELKSQYENIMKEYENEEIDGDTYMQKMMDVATSYKEKHKK